MKIKIVFELPFEVVEGDPDFVARDLSTEVFQFVMSAAGQRANDSWARALALYLGRPVGRIEVSL